MRTTKVMFLLRVSIAFTFFYAAISGFLNPNAWVGFLPPFATEFIPAETVLLIFGVIEVLVALGILFMRRPIYPAIFAFILASGIIGFNFSQMDILFRDVPIALMSIALAIYYKNR